MMRTSTKWLCVAVFCTLVIAVSVWTGLRRTSLHELGTSAAAERLRREARQSDSVYDDRTAALEEELRVIRSARARLDAILQELRRLAPALIACLCVAGMTVNARASDTPRYRLAADGRYCFAATDAAMLLGTWQTAPALRLELRTHVEDRVLAAKEVQILEQLLTLSRQQTQAARARELAWSSLEVELSTTVEQLREKLSQAQRRRRRWIAAVTAVAGGATLGVLLRR